MAALPGYQKCGKTNEAATNEAMIHSGDLHIGGPTVNGDDCGFRGLIREARIYKRALRHS